MGRKNMVRTGDVMLRRVDSIPEGTEKKVMDKVIVAEGEVTGHMHTLNGQGTPLSTYTSDDGEMFVDVAAPAVLTHDEHLTEEIDTGTWKVIRQSEYTREEYRVQAAD